jgi:hypothetical protein
MQVEILYINIRRKGMFFVRKICYARPVWVKFLAYIQVNPCCSGGWTFLE